MPLLGVLVAEGSCVDVHVDASADYDLCRGFVAGDSPVAFHGYVVISLIGICMDSAMRRRRQT